MSLSTNPRSSQWIWVFFFLLIVLPLYAIAAIVCIRSGLFQFNKATISNEQFKAVLAFLAAWLAAGATILGALLTKSHNDRTLAFQAESENRRQVLEDESENRRQVLERETNERLKLDTVVSALNLICRDEGYSSKAVTAGGFATLVQLGHLIVAMRALGPAFEDNAIDPSTLTWLINQVLTSSKTTGTQDDLASAKEEAAALLNKYASTDLTNALIPGRFRWPEAFIAQWPQDLPQNVSIIMISSLIELLLSQSKKWWLDGGATYTWIIYTLDEAVKTEGDSYVGESAAALGKALLEVTETEVIFGMKDWRPKSEVIERMAKFTGDVNPELYERIQTWGCEQSTTAV